jgi:hypothetical protein
LAQAGISILGGLLGGHIGQGTAQVINAIGGFGLNALFLKYSRDLETQADVRGSQILAASGYTPADMVSFFQTLERVDPSKKTNWLSDHPAPPDRISRIEREAKLLRVPDRPTENVAELRTVQRILGGSSPARSMEQIARGNRPATRSRTRSSPGSQAINVEPPSSSMRTYTSRSGVYRVAYPSNWQVYESNSTGVTIAPAGGIGNAGGNSDVVYGAIINHYDPFGNVEGSRLQGMASGGEAISLEDATNDLLTEIQRGSSYLRVSGNGQRVRMSGGTALAATLHGTDPVTGINERVTVVTRQLADEHLIYLLFITPEREASRYNAVLNAMVNSMRIDENRPH